MKALTRLLLWQKFAILGVLALVLVAVPTYQFVNASLVQINFAATERTGIPPSLSLIELIPLLESHRALSAALLSGNDAVKAQVDSDPGQDRRRDQGGRCPGRCACRRQVAGFLGARQAGLGAQLAKSVASRSVTVRESDAEQRKLVARSVHDHGPGRGLHPDHARPRRGHLLPAPDGLCTRWRSWPNRSPGSAMRGPGI